MSLYKRGAIWWIRFTTPDGRELRETARTTDRRAAQELHDLRKAECWRRSRLSSRPRYTWKEAVVRWLEEHSDRKGLGSVISQLRYADSALGACLLDEIDRTRLSTTLRSYRATGVKNSTANALLTVIRTILNAAMAWGWLDHVPQLDTLPVNERRIRWLTREEADRLLAALPPHLAAMARFSLATGLRESNVTMLEWSQVNMHRRCCWIHADQAKAGKAITVPLNEDAMAVLQNQQGLHPHRVFLFRGQPVRRAGKTAWHRALMGAGIADFRWHDLRHTWASWHVQAGTPLAVLKELGGWASLDMVLRYAHLTPDHLAKHAERISSPRFIRTNTDTP
jgi:integrase